MWQCNQWQWCILIFVEFIYNWLPITRVATTIVPPLYHHCSTIVAPLQHHCSTILPPLYHHWNTIIPPLSTHCHFNAIDAAGKHFPSAAESLPLPITIDAAGNACFLQWPSRHSRSRVWGLSVLPFIHLSVHSSVHPSIHPPLRPEAALALINAKVPLIIKENRWKNE